MSMQPRHAPYQVCPPGSVAAATPERAPRELGVFLIIAIVLGVAGILSGGAALVRNITQSREQAVESARSTNDWVAKLPGAVPGHQARQVQEEWIEALVKQQWELRPRFMALGACNLALSAGLLLGAVRTRKGRESGRRLLRVIAWMHLPYQALHAANTLTLSLCMATLNQEYVPRLVAATTGGSGSEIITKATQAGQYIGVVGAAGHAIALAAFYVVLALYLNRPASRAFCH